MPYDPFAGGSGPVVTGAEEGWDWLSNQGKDIFGKGGKPDQTELAKEQIAQSSANAQDAYLRAISEAAKSGAYAGPAPVVAPTIAAPDQLNRFDYWNTAPTTATAVDAADRMRLANTFEVLPVGKAQVSGIDTNISVPTMEPAAQTERVSVGKVSGDPLAEALRARQIQAAEGIASAPSAAMSTLAAGQSRSLEDALSIAAQARGDERGAARREAILAAQQGSTEAAFRAAALGAQEQQARAAQTTEALGAIRGADVSTAIARQNLAAQHAQLQAQIDAAIAQGNTQAVNALRQRQAELETSARTASVQAGLGQQNTMAGLAQANLGVAANAAAANAAAKNAAAGNFAASQNAAAEAAAARATQVNLANVQTGQAQTEANLGRALTTGATNIANTQATRTTNAANQLAANTTNAGNALNAQQLRQTGTTTALNTGINASNTQGSNAGTVVNANKSAAETDQRSDAAKMAMIGAGIAAIASDERLKQDIRPIPQGEINDLAQALVTSAKPVTYRYRPGEEDGGANTHVGELAQQLERTALGSRLVQRRPDGMREVDYGGLAALAPALALAAVRSQKGARR